MSKEVVERKKIEEKLRGVSGGGSCKDNNNQCCSWASTGECTSNPNYMSMECQLSCNLCPNRTAKTVVARARGEEQWFIQDNCGKEDRDTKQG